MSPEWTRVYWDMKYDVFICHASEDKDLVARPLAKSLRLAGVRVWYDEFSLRLGDSLSESIDAGLARSRFGVVIISKHFLEKPWPKRELRGLIARELDSGGRVLLPVWHQISKNDLIAASPPLADVLAVSTSGGLDRVTEKILEVVLPRKVSTTAAKMSESHEIGPMVLIGGDYLVVGQDPDGRKYRGRSTVREYDGTVIVVSKIGAATHICQGRRKHNKIRVFGDFEVDYHVSEDGALRGMWGNGGVETLTPIVFCDDPSSVLGLPDYAGSHNRRPD